MGAFGRARIEIEKEKMRDVLSREISRCVENENTMSRATRHFCDYYKKDEFLMIDKLRDAQGKRSIEIISRLKHNNTRQRYYMLESKIQIHYPLFNLNYKMEYLMFSILLKTKQ